MGKQNHMAATYFILTVLLRCDPYSILIFCLQALQERPVHTSNNQIHTDFKFTCTCVKSGSPASSRLLVRVNSVCVHTDSSRSKSSRTLVQIVFAV